MRPSLFTDKMIKKVFLLDSNLTPGILEKGHRGEFSRGERFSNFRSEPRQGLKPVLKWVRLSSEWIRQFLNILRRAFGDETTKKCFQQSSKARQPSILSIFLWNQTLPNWQRIPSLHSCFCLFVLRRKLLWTKYQLQTSNFNSIICWNFPCIVELEM